MAQKTPAQALADIKGYTSANRIFVTSHAQMRLRQRGLTAEDLRSAIRSATSAEWREEDKAWRVSGGKDLDNEETIFGAALEEPGVRITTIF